jgi:hypothetical protein
MTKQEFVDMYIPGEKWLCKSADCCSDCDSWPCITEVRLQLQKV